MRHLLVAGLLLAGCGVRMQDPCAGVAGACIAVQVEPSDTLNEAADVSLWLTLDGVARPAQLVDGGTPLRLPIALGLVFDSLPSSSAQLSVAVTGSHDGVSYRSQTVVRTLATGEHFTIRVELSAQSSQPVAADLATGTDSADLLPPATKPQDMTLPPADMTTPIAARLLSPMSTATVTSQRPRLTWTAPQGGAVTDLVVDLCSDRACSGNVLQPVTLDASGNSGIPLANLPPGVVFWRVRAMVAGVPTVSAVWQFYVGYISANVSTAYGTTLDYNGDGYADFVIGAQGAVNGRAYAFPGGRRSTVGTTNTVLVPEPEASCFGESVASAGDVDGDGYADIIVGAYNGLGRAYVYFGGSEGIDTAHYATLTNGTNEGNDFGWSVAGASDIDGDGYGDVLVGKYGGSEGEVVVHVFWGGPRDTLGQAYATIAADIAVSAGDVDGDGLADIVADTAGGAAIFWGGDRDTFAAQLPTVLISTVHPSNGGFGCAGDIDGDGYSEVIVGDPASMAANVYFGGSARSALAATVQTISSTHLVAAGIPGFGSTVSGMGDVRAAGYSSVMIGASPVNNNAGVVYSTETPGVVRGRSFEALQTVGNGTDGSQYGDSLAAVGDVDGDGYADVLIGAPDFDGAIGKAYLIFGGTILPLTNGADGGQFGISVAGLVRGPRADVVARLRRSWSPQRRSHRL